MDYTANAIKESANATSDGQVTNAINSLATTDAPITVNAETVRACVPEDGMANTVLFVSYRVNPIKRSVKSVSAAELKLINHPGDDTQISASYDCVFIGREEG